MCIQDIVVFLPVKDKIESSDYGEKYLVGRNISLC